jgi:hypothetical protein
MGLEVGLELVPSSKHVFRDSRTSADPSGYLSAAHNTTQFLRLKSPNEFLEHQVEFGRWKIF